MLRKTLIIAPIFIAVGFGLGTVLVNGTDSDGQRLAMGPGDLGGLLKGKDYNFTDLRVLSAVVIKVRDEYLDPRRPDPEAMLEAALRRVEHLVPEAIFQESFADGRVRILVGNEERSIPTGDLESVTALAGTFRALAKELDVILPPEVDRRDVEYALINGMLSTLDPHSVLIVPDDYENMRSDNDGSFGGLGISIQIIDRRLTVTCPMQDTPAARAGLQSGDVITSIETVSTTNMPIDEAVRRLRGPIGAPVTITINREDVDPFEVEVVRDSIMLPHLESLYLGDGVGYIRLRKFYRHAFPDLQAAIDALSEQAGRRIEGVVLDFRNNPGGLLMQAEEIADLFLDKGDIVSVVGADDRRPDVTNAKTFGTIRDLRLAILVNSDTASASEIVAGALQAHDRAVVMGVRSFGKGSVQNLFPYDEGSALKLTTAEYLTSGKRSIQSQGILPDIELRPSWVGEDVNLHFQDAAFREENIEKALTSRYTKAMDPPDRVIYYLEPKLSPDAPPRDRFDCRGVREMSDDFQVQAARTLLAWSKSPNASKMLKEAESAMDNFLAGRERELREQIETKGYSWDEQGSIDKPDLKLTYRVDSEDGFLTAGDESAMVFTLENQGKSRVPRLRGIIDSDLRALGGREVLFGSLGPGESSEYRLKVTVGPDIYSLVEEAELKVHSGDSDAVATFPLRVTVREQDLPHFEISVALIDDGRDGTKGNGDGMPAPGEQLELAVTVRNVGTAPTGDRWMKEWWHRANDERKEKQRTTKEGACFVTVWETSGNSLYFPEGQGGGSCSGWADDMAFTTPLAPGETRRLSFRFEVPGPLMVETPRGNEIPADSANPVKLHVTVRDQALWESADEELRLIPAAVPLAMKPADKELVTRGEVPARVAAGADAKVVARIDGPIKAVAQVGDFWRVELPWGVPGFVADADVKSGKGRGDARITEVLAQRPPLVELKGVPELITDAATIHLSGTVSDDEGVEHLLVFINGRKVRVLTPARAGGIDTRFDFKVELELDEGVNAIELVARDRSEGSAGRSLAVFREAPNGGESTAESAK